jgi:transcriptional antiterminator NusG
MAASGYIRNDLEDIALFVSTNATYPGDKKGVFNFVGVGDKPLPLTEKEMQSLGIDELVSVDYEVGDSVRITTEPFYNYPATIEEIFLRLPNLKV